MHLSKNLWSRNKIIRYFGILLSIFILQALFINASPVDTEVRQKKFADGRVLVQPKGGLTQEKLDKIIANHGGKSVGKISKLNVHILQVPSGAEEAVASALSHNQNIDFAEVDRLVPLNQTPNDPYFSSQWHHPIIGTHLAWDLALGSNITIAILDTGVDGTHPDLAANMVPGYNFYYGNSDTRDVYGHGTKVAGTAAGIGNNGIGIAGAAWNSKIMPMKIGNDVDGYGSWSAMANALTWAADRGARVANISYMAHDSLTVQNASQYFKNKGGLVVSSGGNSGALVNTPSTDALITVSATASNDSRTSWSTYGPYIDLAAPGAGIYTTVNGGGYGSVSGTSFSAPLTAGVIALMMSSNPGLSPNQITSILLSTTKDLGEPGWDQYYGHGRVDAAAAVQAAANAVASDSQNPNTSISSPLAGSIVKGTISVDVTASDNYGVTRVDLFAGATLIGSDTLSPYNFVLDTTLIADGSLTLQAKAYDAAGNIGTASVTVSVRNTVDTIAPIVNINSPADGAKLSTKANTTISASATDNIGVTAMIIFVDGVQKATSTSGSVSFGLNVRKMSSGLHTIKVDARDASGNLGSKTIQVTK